MRYSKGTLKKIEDLFKDLDYTIRYEKGNFQSGYCLVESKRVVVVNKFFDVEGRINALMDIISNLEVDLEAISEETQIFFEK